jgi:NADP-dependent 3-hydroxy acid dehydrogenase YdfG
LVLYVTHAALPHLVRAAEDSPSEVADRSTSAPRPDGRHDPEAASTASPSSASPPSPGRFRHELITKRVRVSVVEPGTVATELVSHLREDVRRAERSQMESIEALRPEDIADAVSYIVTRDRRVALNEILVRAAEQSW